MDQLSLFDAPPPPEGGTPSTTPIEPTEPPNRPIILTVEQFEWLGRHYSADVLAPHNRTPTVRGILELDGQFLVCVGQGYDGASGTETRSITRVARAAGRVVPDRSERSYHGTRFTYRGEQWFCYGGGENHTKPIGQLMTVAEALADPQAFVDGMQEL